MAFISRESGVSEDSSIHPSFMTATDEDPFAAAETSAAIDAKRNLLDDLNRCRRTRGGNGTTLPGNVKYA